jgi:hypothetical protein
MKIVSIVGKLKSDELTVTKSIGSLIFGLSIPLADLLNEKISIYIERGNGNNVILANKVNLKDFILACTYGNETIQSDENYKAIALCEIALDGSIFLAEKESIKIQLDDLRAPNTYDVYGVEEPDFTQKILMFEQKTVASEEYNKKIDLKGFDLCVLTLSETISDISMHFMNGQVVKYLPFELQTLSRDVDPIQSISDTGVVTQNLSTRLVSNLLGVDYVEINKSQGAIINILARTVKNIQ